MSIATLILGQSGTGKTTSLRNFNPQTQQALLIKVIEKPLPFRAGNWQGRQVQTDQWQSIIAKAQKAVERGAKIIIIDDFQYLLANEFMRRTEEKGFDKFTEIGRHAWEVISALSNLPEHVRVYIMAHTQEDDFGRTKMKTIGRMLDEKITVEGLFSIVLRTQVRDGKYFFRTQNDGNDTTKAPMDLFSSDLIDNDLAAVDAEICDFYGINPAANQEQSA